MRRRSWLAAKLYLRLQWRCGLPQVVVATSIVSWIGLRLALPEAIRLWLLPPLLLTEACSLTFALVGAQTYLERSEGSAAALAVTPLRGAESALGRVGAAAAVAASGGALVYGGVVGVDARMAAVAALLVLGAALSGFVGLALATHYTQFTRFVVVAMTPALVALQLPLLTYLEWVPRATFAWLPTDAALFAIASLVRGTPDAMPLLGQLALLLGWSWLALRWAAHRVDALHHGRLAGGSA